MRFPGIHIATSAVNRILDLADQEMVISAASAASPDIPDTKQMGAALDQALTTPVPAVPAPEGSGEAIAVESQAGGTAADAVGGMAVLDSL